MLQNDKRHVKKKMWGFGQNNYNAVTQNDDGYYL